jgi:phage host-nuclease inhibitor protein Gam
MKKSKRLKAVGLTTREEFEIVIERVALLTTKIREIEAQRDQAIQAVQQAFASDLDACSAAIKADVALCEKFAEEHRAELLTGKAKSNETPLARYGFRLGNRTVVLASKQWKWTDVLTALKEHNATECIRLVEEVDKEAVLKATNDEEGLLSYHDADFDGTVQIAIVDLGMKIKQAETFFIEPKVDGADLVKGGAS